METAQRVIRRSGLFSRLMSAMAGLCFLLLCYSVLRENMPSRLTSTWPWKLRLLDIQSATTATIGTVGALLARAQYARVVRPVLGYFGRTMADLAPDGQLAWTCHLINGAQDVAVVEEIDYQVRFTRSALSDGAVDIAHWESGRAAIAALASRGLEQHKDFTLHAIGPGRPIPGQGLMLLGWFTERAMREAECVIVRVRVVDRVGDTHERCVNLLKEANRHPRRPDAQLF
ncbi:hypothetical protein [Streptomyces sp. NPDC056045]|uniref:hypothetical protein n=1 Tax=unclassified Streptomyces TaxID=2593676 RepID=UPI0035D694EF